MTTLRRRVVLTAAWAAALTALLLVFSSYLDPHLMADLASRAWACF